MLKPCTAAVAKALIEPLGAVYVTLKYRHGDHSVSRDLGNVPRVCRGRGSQREARAAAWEAGLRKVNNRVRARRATSLLEDFSSFEFNSQELKLSSICQPSRA